MMNKTTKCILAVLLAALIGMLAVVVTVLILPEQFDQLYFGEMADKYARLRSLDDENKIVVIGGSSVAFGINSRMMEENTGYPTVNFGLYGPLGTAIMMDLTRGHIHEGDIVVLAPETDHQTMSMYFNGEGMWECVDSDFTMLFKVRARDWPEMLGSFWTYAEKKYQFYLYGKARPDGVYGHDSFDEYGDISYRRESNVMEGWYDTEVPVDLDSSIIDQEYIDYVNDYIRYCEKQGAAVYFSWPPINALAVQQDLSGVLEYATFVRENFHCQMISSITQYIMAPGFFYDTNYHVTDSGVIMHTARLIQDLENVLGDGSKVNIVLPDTPVSENGGVSGEPMAGPNGAMPLPRGRNSANAGGVIGAPDTAPVQQEETQTDVPEPDEPQETPVPTPEAVGSSRDADFFIAEEFTEGLMITGVTEEGKTKTELEIPWMIDGTKVVAIGSNAFDGCVSLTSITIQNNISRIMQSAFDGCPRLREIHILNTNGADILIPGTGLFDNVPSITKVYVPAQSYGLYLGDYFWGNYNDRLEKDN